MTPANGASSGKDEERAVIRQHEDGLSNEALGGFRPGDGGLRMQFAEKSARPEIPGGLVVEGDFEVLLTEG